MIKEILFKIQQEFKSSKNLINDFAKFNYRNLEGMLADLKPILSKYNCIITFNDDIVNIGNYNYIKSTATLTSVLDNESISTTAFAREDETKAGMSAGQMTGCGSSYSRKYALCGLCAVNEEKDLDSLDNRPQKQTKTPNKPIIENNSMDWIDELPVKPQTTQPVELSPADQLTQWYNTVEHTPVIDKFYTYWVKRLTEKGWSGQFKLQNLIEKYCK